MYTAFVCHVDIVPSVPRACTKQCTFVETTHTHYPLPLTFNIPKDHYSDVLTGMLQVLVGRTQVRHNTQTDLLGNVPRWRAARVTTNGLI